MALGRKILILFSLLIYQHLSRAADYELVKDLSINWYYNDGSLSLPYVKGNNINPIAIHFELNLARHAENYLMVRHPHPGVLFVDGKVFKVFEKQVDQRFPIDSLRDIFSRERIMISYFSEFGEYDRLTTQISAATYFLSGSSPVNDISLRTRYERSGLIIILILLMSFFTISLNRNGKTFQDFYSIEQTIAGRIRDDSVYKMKLFSQNNLAIFLFHASVISFLIILLSKYSNTVLAIENYFPSSDFLTWGLLSLLIFFAFFIKYFIIRYIGELFDLGNSANYYFYEYMRLSTTFFFILLIGASVVVISFPHAANDLSRTAINITFAFMVIRVVFLFFRLGKVSGFKNVHLFSYLCTTETLPIIVGMRYFLS